MEEAWAASAPVAEAAEAAWASPGAPGFQLVIWTDDVDTAYDVLLAAGVPTVTPPHDTGNGNRNTVVRDPDGNLVEIVAKRG